MTGREAELSELAERVERATGEDLSADLDIARMQGVTVWCRNADDTDNFEHTYWRYTAKIDDAASLVPEGADWAISTVRNGHGGFAQIMRVDEPDIEVKAASPALALAAAALKSRAASVGRNPKERSGGKER